VFVAANAVVAIVSCLFVVGNLQHVVLGNTRR
jgi:hypothetical protein